MSAFQWEVCSPTAYGTSPEEMSYSVLTAIEACPRRFSLERGEYSAHQRGYPRAVAWGALRGTVIHDALDRFAGALSQLPADTPSERRVPSTLAALGGLTTLAKTSLEGTLKDLSKNPRAEGQLAVVRARLTREVPQIRAELQARLQRLQWPRPSGPKATTSPSGASSGTLREGIYPELTVHAPSIGWKGTLDLLILGEEGATILEFKTGKRKPEHHDQLRSYALLWSLEPRNRSAEGPKRLTLIYPDGQVELPAPTEDELRALKAELSRRTTSAAEALRPTPPAAKVSAEGCGYCGVRHLCTEYWLKLSSLPPGEGDFSDLEVRVSAGRGPGLYAVRVKCGPAHLQGKEVLLILPSHAQHPVGSCLRILAARCAQSEDSPGELVASVGPQGEVFRVP